MSRRCYDDTDEQRSTKVEILRTFLALFHSIFLAQGLTLLLLLLSVL